MVTINYKQKKRDVDHEEENARERWVQKARGKWKKGQRGTKKKKNTVSQRVK